MKPPSSAGSAEVIYYAACAKRAYATLDLKLRARRLQFSCMVLWELECLDRVGFGGCVSSLGRVSVGLCRGLLLAL